jgi:uncharacterized protein with PQ loop repeat
LKSPSFFVPIFILGVFESDYFMQNLENELSADQPEQAIYAKKHFHARHRASFFYCRAMDTDPGFANSFSGFVDYDACYHEVAPLWVAVGAVVFVGTGLSIVPQIYRVARLRTSAGVSTLFVAITSLSQALIVVNFFCLHNADFYGALQIAPARTVPRFLSAAIAFVLWLVYLPVAFLTFLFSDAALHGREYRLSVALSAGLVLLSLLLLAPYFAVGARAGFGSRAIARLGKICGIVSSALSVCQYAPQFVAVCRLQDNGSFSLVTLAIQAPGGTISTSFMAFGNGEDWSTWLPLGTSALQQWFLLALCLFYKAKQCARRRAGADPRALLSTGDFASMESEE